MSIKADANGEKGRVSSLGEAEVAPTRPVVSARSAHFEAAPLREMLSSDVTGERVDLVKRWVEAWNAQDSEGVVETLDPEIEMHWHDEQTYPDTHSMFRG